MKTFDESQTCQWKSWTKTVDRMSNQRSARGMKERQSNARTPTTREWLLYRLSKRTVRGRRQARFRRHRSGPYRQDGQSIHRPGHGASQPNPLAFHIKYISEPLAIVLAFRRIRISRMKPERGFRAPRHWPRGELRAQWPPAQSGNGAYYPGPDTVLSSSRRLLWSKTFY